VRPTSLETCAYCGATRSPRDGFRPRVILPPKEVGMSYVPLRVHYRKKHGKLIEPRQGFGSLHPSLWLAYSMGRVRGFTDLGTYAKKPGDHGKWPSRAFDLGRDDRFLFKGWGYIKARRLARLYVKHHRELNVNYVILGRRIWSRSRPYWHPLTTGDTSHDFHVHVSGSE
jgi:hypothetical protein